MAINKGEPHSGLHPLHKDNLENFLRKKMLKKLTQVFFNSCIWELRVPMVSSSIFLTFLVYIYYFQSGKWVSHLKTVHTEN